MQLAAMAIVITSIGLDIPIYSVIDPDFRFVPWIIAIIAGTNTLFPDLHLKFLKRNCKAHVCQLNKNVFQSMT